ncbi:helix-turn-helix domain-containing protein [Caminibacter pacificus]|uniref:Helix-turn-helix protein n=2 Tax=Caminibacter pacificus TaxID=1424653 RepID=A0AAJ4RBB0_9BACT|nr:helix-turn-helix domain-containing protein [Caminibacter pacificus]ROR39066.1 helix-turn-helix protein [Caminibacter pacificus]
MNRAELLSQLGVDEVQRLMAEAIKGMVKKEWLTPEELQEEYGISIHAQNRMRMERRIPYSKVGKFIRYKRSEIEKWLEDHKIEMVGG